MLFQSPLEIGSNPNIIGGIATFENVYNEGLQHSRLCRYRADSNSVVDGFHDRFTTASSAFVFAQAD